jgi:PAS domain S-box-containing protein
MKPVKSRAARRPASRPPKSDRRRTTGGTPPARERLRLSDAASNAAILNALPVHIALIDTRGLIVSVNESWRRSAFAGAVQSPGHETGLNYLDICDSAPGDGSSGARQLAQGVRSVLDGREKTFSIEYPCHTLTEQRWFLMTATPLAGERPDGVVVMHTDITQRKQASDVLHESERRFTHLLGSIEMIALMLDTHSRITYCNNYFLGLTGWKSAEVIGRNWFEAFVPPENTAVKDIYAALLANLPESWHHENEILIRSGERRLIRWNNSVLRSGAGDVTGTASIGEDITDQKQAEVRIRHLNRVYAVSSGINSLIVRVSDREELFREACRVAVEAGGFRMALIAIVDQDAKQIVPVASAGKDEGLLTAIRHVLSSSEHASRTMIARAIRGKRPVISNDSQSDLGVVFGRNYAECEVRSMAVVPLMVADVAVGALALYATEIDFFHGEELKLLTELGGDISFALASIGRRQKLNDSQGFQ